MSKRIFAFLMLLMLLAGAGRAEPKTTSLFMTSFYDEAPGFPLEPGWEMMHGAWIEDTHVSALLLLGNEAEDETRLAIVRRAEEGDFRVIAQSGPIMPYAKLRCDNIYDLVYMDYDEVFDHVFIWYTVGHAETVYVVMNDLGEDDWRVTYGCLTSEEEELDFSFEFAPSEREGVIAVYDSYSPQICWPIEGHMELEGFDLPALTGECIEALKYLKHFGETHRHGEQDETYRILWDARNGE